MITQLILKLRILPRWVIILIDLGLVAFSTLLGYLLRFNFVTEQLVAYNAEIGILVNVLCVMGAILLTRSYAGIVRYTGLRDGVRLFYTLALSVLMVVAVNMIYYSNYQANLIPYSVLLISFLASFLFLYQYRLLIKNIFSYYRKLTSKNRRVIIFGAGQLGIITQQVIDSTPDSDLKVVAFVEDDIRKVGKFINGTQIYSAQDDFELLLNSLNADELIISIDKLSFERKNDIVDLCLKHDIRVRTVPKAEEWMKGDFSFKQIKEINIEDLLGRQSIKLENEEVERQINNKHVCITGAAGSIGSELVRQVFQYNPASVILIDQAESPLYEIEMEISAKKVKNPFHCYVADIRDKDRILEILRKHKPDIIFHAAAYKHVPLMERNPFEAVRCNILGTRNLADAAVELGVKKFVMVSTDKAVNPTNVMGCSKRISEIYVQSLNNHIHAAGEGTMFVTTRFGNVLGSNGSVIPFFKKQIANGGPVTVTHPEITRYFMTISEACQLVLEAGAMGNGGEIFIFDMGKSIKIVDLAKKMIRLSGLELNKDIDIVFTGLRDGEKLYEELLANKENTQPTHHEKIMIATVVQYEYESILRSIASLEKLTNTQRDPYEIVAQMKSIVPEFKSNSSEFQVLDKMINPN
ncbi:polysaccharide biosynthesis protein [Fulvivirga sedimenti]|uniref:Polysaccharide biosynthesis protein n=1 Tax=Fulvivirga sedimenti TaxID=2879465 RepID=A0A9X1HM73_9BACT|nr:nucleoside-diphosphate sugar epimerase/dehydratase [Fulvivirga sedimenti]MCA6073403.1 polysaccharide biosynthesis protein [Fulvivirga sedimenti]